VLVLSRFMEQFISIPIHTALAEMIGADLLDPAAAAAEPRTTGAFIAAERSGAQGSGDPATVRVPVAKLPAGEQPAGIQSRLLESLKTTTGTLEQPPAARPPSDGPGREPSQIKDLLNQAVRADSRRWVCGQRCLRHPT
jgi:hypothetical protein